MPELTGKLLYKYAVGHSKPWSETSMQPLFNEAARQLNDELRCTENEEINVLLKAFNDLLVYHLFGHGNVVDVLNVVLRVMQRHPKIGVISLRQTRKTEETMPIKDIGEATELLKEFIFLLTDEELMIEDSSDDWYERRDGAIEQAASLVGLKVVRVGGMLRVEEEQS